MSLTSLGVVLVIENAIFMRSAAFLSVNVSNIGRRIYAKSDLYGLLRRELLDVGQ